MSVNKPLQQPPMATATDPQRPQQQRAPSLSALSEISSTSTHISSFPFPLPSSFGPHPTSAEAATAAAAAAAADPPLPLSPLARSPVSVTSARDTKGPNKGRSSISAAQPIRRKPLSSTASSVATRYSSGQYLATLATSLPRPEQGYDRSFSVASSTDYKFPQPPLGPMSRRSHWEFTAEPTDTGTGDTVSTHDHDGGTSPEHQLPHSSPLRHGIPVAGAAEVPPPDSGDIDHASPHAALSHPDQSQALYDDLYPDEDQDEDQDEDASSDHILDGYNSDNSSDNANSSPVDENTMPLQVPRKHIPHHLTINPNQARRGSASNDPKTGNSDKPLPKSPGSSRLGSFFGWAPSPTTEYSEKTYSPLASPFARSKSISQSDASPLITTGPQSSYEAAKAELSTSGSLDYSDSYLATPSARSTDPSELDEMEDELKAISAELASSIRREIDLEDMVEKLQAEKDNTAAAAGNKRTSDYYSDSGYSSAKFSEYDQSREEVEKIQRRSELEKAQLRLELTTKLQDERLRRQKMDEQIRDLSTKASQLDIAAMNNADASTRIKELEMTCETLRRKLSEERQVKDNFEDLLTALRGELQDTLNERDNLRDEVVPQLQARVDGLENQATDLEKMAYESTKMQQELNTLRYENSNLKQFQMSSISEEGATISAPLSRSNSVGGPRSSIEPRRPPSLISWSKTVAKPESRDNISERLKCVEEQRDALHRAVRVLLFTQERENRENQKKIKYLEMERDRLLTSSPEKAGFQKEINNLRVEITVLRRRAEEALDQKWQVEKGLAGLKMDLDKAEQEVGHLRKLLEEKDILIPPAFARFSAGSDPLATPVTSQSLMASYHDLQQAYANSLERIRRLEANAMDDERIQMAVQKLEAALSSAVSERDFAQNEAESYKEQLDALKAGEQAYIESEKALADELQESARRVEELALQVQRQLSTNQQLRIRITDTITRGDATQKANAARITSMQAHLRSLEEKLEAAQASSEDRVTHHEEEALALFESQSVQLIRRRRDGPREARNFPSKSKLSPLFTTPGVPTPRLSSTRSGPAMTVFEESQVDQLKARVAELENALMDADAEMQQVIGRMNTAQIEVLHLQEERETAIDQTRKLERELQSERAKALDGRFKTLLS